MLLRIAFVLFAVAGMSHIIFGIVYVTADQFMPYHAQALSSEWNDLDANYKTLFLALIKLAGTGGLVAGIVNLSLVAYLFKRTSSRLIWLLPIPGLIFQLVTNYVVYSVYTDTPGEPPLVIVSIGTGVLILATVILFVGIRGDHA